MRTVTHKIMLRVVGGDPLWVEVRGYPLNKLRPPFKFVLHRTWDAMAQAQSPRGFWTVTEIVTGRSVAKGTSKQEAVNAAREVMEDLSNSAIGEYIFSQMVNQ